MGNVMVIPAKRKIGNTNRKKDTKPKLRVAAYCRVSTDSDEQATSYEAQVEHYTEYIKRNPDWEFAGIYADDGISGTNTKNREEFNRLIKDCEAGTIDMVITKSISRFARNTLDCLKYIRRLKEKNIPVRLLNALQPSASGTLISNTAEKEAIKAVAAKDNITYVKIKSLHTIPTPHFLSIVFDTFYNYNTPVDMVTTSDIGVSVAIDNDKHIDEIVGVLREYATITVEKNMVIVCVVGDLEWQNVGFEARIINALKDIPVRMISYGGSSSNVSLVMKAEDKVHALKALSEHLFSVSDIY